MTNKHFGLWMNHADDLLPKWGTYPVYNIGNDVINIQF